MAEAIVSCTARYAHTIFWRDRSWKNVWVCWTCHPPGFRPMCRLDTREVGFWGKREGVVSWHPWDWRELAEPEEQRFTVPSDARPTLATSTRRGGVVAGKFHDEMTLREARDLLRTLVEEGHECPCCTQLAKVYKFPVNAAIARALILMYQRNGTGWVDVPDLGLPGGHFAKLRFWGLIERPEGRRDDGSTRVGVWRVTGKGEQWILRRSTIPQKARIYNNRCLGLTGDEVTIEQALGKQFNYAELMADA